MKKIWFTGLMILCLTQLWSIFGKNKIQQDSIEWSVIKTLHYDIYYEKGNDEFGKTAALMTEEAYYYLKDGFQRPIRKRIPVIFYSSNQDFETTNIIPNLLSEGVGGFTESQRNRVAVPFSGSYLAMEETLIHELTHAYVNDLNSARNSLFTFNSLPFWFSEGLPEYFSIGGESTENNIYVMDLIFNGQIPDFSYLQGFYAYRLGELFITYLSEEYGEEKVMEFFYALRFSKNQELAVKEIFDLEFEELQNHWKNHLKRKYSEYMRDYDVPYEVFEQLTNHLKDGSGTNSPVAFVPGTGEYLYFSDKSIHRDIYKNSYLDPQKPKRIIKGETSGDIEEFHYQRHNLAFFPDGDRFAFATKTSYGDAIQIASISKKKIIETLRIPEIEVIYKLDINAAGDKIAFGGQKDFSADIYIYDLKTAELQQLTDDNYYDGEPCWNAAGDKLAFVSERSSYDSKKDNHLFYQLSRDIYYYDFAEKKYYQVTHEEENNSSPIWDKTGENLLFLHEDEATRNFQIIQLATGDRANVTNVLGSVSSGDLDSENDELLVSSFYDRGWDVFLVSNPLKDLQYVAGNTPERVEFVDDFYTKFEINEYKYFGVRERKFRKELPEMRKDITRFNLGSIIEQDSLDRAYNEKLDSKPVDLKTPEIADYKTRFFLDHLWGGLAYSPSGGTFAQLQFSMSDLMGDKAIGVTLGINGEIENSNIQLNYLYLANRVDYGFGTFYLNDETVYQFLNSSGTSVFGYLRERQRDLGVMGTIRFPFNKFWRLDFDTILYRHELHYDWIYNSSDDWMIDFVDPIIDSQYEINPYNENIISPQLTLNFDNAIYGATGPISGWKAAVLVNYSYTNLKDYSLIYTDIRKYLFFNKRYALAGRFIGGTFTGDAESSFGLDYYSGVRGFYDDELLGKNKLLTNLELRFPFIDHLAFAFPLPIYLSNIRGSAFIDAGSVWDDDLKLADKGRLQDLKLGMGFGPRINVGYFVIKLDVAWNTDLEDFSRPSYYFSLSPDF